jgi:hypothetical protein
MKPINEWKGAIRYILEFLLVVAGVFLGLFLNQLAQKNDNKKLAQTCSNNFITEIDTNKAELQRCLIQHHQFFDTLVFLLKVTGNYTFSNLNFEVPELTEASWESAVATKGLIYLKNPEVIQLSKCYEAQEFMKGLHQKVIDMLMSRTLIEKITSVKVTRAEINVELTILLSYLSNLINTEESMLGTYDETIVVLISGK